MVDLRVGCGHEGVQVRVLDENGLESVSCVDCIADEIQDLPAGQVYRWEIERLPREQDDRSWETTQDLSALPF